MLDMLKRFEEEQAEGHDPEASDNDDEEIQDDLAKRIEGIDLGGPLCLLLPIMSDSSMPRLSRPGQNLVASVGLAACRLSASCAESFQRTRTRALIQC